MVIPNCTPTDASSHGAQRLHHEKFDAIYVTNLRRTVETAQPLCEALNLAPIASSAKLICEPSAPTPDTAEVR